MAEALRFKLTSPDISRVIASSRSAIREVIAGTDPAIAAAAVLIRIMRESIRQPGSGRVYIVEWRFSRRRGKPFPTRIPRRGGPHRASAPAEPPASDTGNLINQLGFEPRGPGRVAIGVTNAAPYWKYLEFGTRFMEPRPFIRPAIVIAETGMTDAYLRKMRERARQILARGR